MTIEELLKEIKNEKVEWKTIKQIINEKDLIVRRGSFPQPYTDLSFYGGEGAMPFVQVADVSDNFLSLNETTKKTISKKAQPNSIFAPKNTIVVTLQGTIGRVAITQYDAYIDRTLGIFSNLNEKKFNQKYFAYILKQKFDYEKQFARGSTLKTITKDDFYDFEIPIPQLSTQEKIVEILDKFTELTAELTARGKQYEYYRNQLLDFSKIGGHRLILKKLKIFAR